MKKFSDHFLFRRWKSIETKTPPTGENILLLFDDGTIYIGQYMPENFLAKFYQPFGTEERGIFTGKAKVIKWAELDLDDSNSF